MEQSGGRGKRVRVIFYFIVLHAARGAMAAELLYTYNRILSQTGMAVTVELPRENGCDVYSVPARLV